MADSSSTSVTKSASAAKNHAPRHVARAGQARASAIDAIAPGAQSFNDVLSGQMASTTADPAATDASAATATKPAKPRRAQGADTDPKAEAPVERPAAGAEPATAVADAALMAALAAQVATPTAGARPEAPAEAAGEDPALAEVGGHDGAPAAGKRGPRRAGSEDPAALDAPGKDGTPAAAASRSTSGAAHAAQPHGKRAHGPDGLSGRGAGSEAHGKAVGAKDGGTGRDARALERDAQAAPPSDVAREATMNALAPDARAESARATGQAAATSMVAERLAEAAQTVTGASGVDAASSALASLTPGIAPGEARGADGSAPTVYTTATPMADPRWPDELARIVSIGIQDRVQEAEIRIDPVDLGPIRLRVSLEGDTASVSFTAAQGETRARLEGSLEQLRTALADAGIQLGNATVQTGESGSRGDARDEGRSGRGNRGRGAEVSGALRQVAVPGGPPRGLVDTFA